MADAGRKSASRSRTASPEGRGKAKSGSAKPGGKDAVALLEALREEVSRLGGSLPDAWTCIVRPRPNAVGSDPYYISPSGRRFRSRQEVRGGAGGCASA
jgi:hypothetical protein